MVQYHVSIFSRIFDAEVVDVTEFAEVTERGELYNRSTFDFVVKKYLKRVDQASSSRSLDHHKQPSCGLHFETSNHSPP